MVSAIFIYLLAIGLSAASSQLITGDVEFFEGPMSDRRTFKHGKPLKLLPLIKKHKKFAKLVPHVFGKDSYTEVPIIHEALKPIYKVHRYQGIEVKSVPDVAFSTPETSIESHSTEPQSGDFVPTYASDHYFSAPLHSSRVLLYPVNEKPIFSEPIFAPLLPQPPKPIFSFVPASPIASIASSPVFSSFSIVRPALNPISALPAPVLTPIPPSPLPPSTFSSSPIKIQAPVLPPLPSPSPEPLFTSVPVKIQAPILPPIFMPSSRNVFSAVSIKIPAKPILPSVSTPSAAPVFPSISSISPTPEPAFSSLPVSISPVQFSVVPSPTPSVFPFPAPALSSISDSTTKQIQEPEYPYPSSGTPIASYINDVSLGDTEIKDSSLAAIEKSKYEDITSSVNIDGSKHLDHVLDLIRNENGFLQKIKGWKADKANAALSHFTHFKHKPVTQSSISLSHPPHKTLVEVSTPQVPIYQTSQFSGTTHSLPLAPAPVFFPFKSFLPPTKYDNFPPNNIESPPLLNSYGVPISHNSYALTHAYHDRLSSAASEEELAAIVPAPSVEKNEPNHETQQKPSQIQNFQSQPQPHGILQNHSVYVAENDETVKENKTNEDTQLKADDYDTEKESKADEAATQAQHYLNHKK